MLQVYERLQKLNITVSHRQLLRLIDKLGMNHDGKVLEWRDALVVELKNTTTVQVCGSCVHVHGRLEGIAYP